MKKPCLIQIKGDTYELNQKFCDYFTKEELDIIAKNYSYISELVIVYIDDEYFIELSADIKPDELDVYVEKNDKHINVSKRELLEIFKRRKHKNLPVITIDE